MKIKIKNENESLSFVTVSNAMFGEASFAPKRPHSFTGKTSSQPLFIPQLDTGLLLNERCVAK